MLTKGSDGIQYLKEMNTKIRYICEKENINANFISCNINDEDPWIVTHCSTFELSELLYNPEELDEQTNGRH